jgi:uncharacterized membrane protein YphA (DoxX/SURF4 family)
MPFQPIPDKGPKRPGSSDIGLFVIRLLTAVTFSYYQLLGLLSKAKNHVWDKAEWDLVTKFLELGIPVPGVLATVFVTLLLLSIIGIVVGIFTRFNALFLLLSTIAILIVPFSLAPSLTPQALVLYIAVFLGLLLGGSGKASLDYRLAGRKKKKAGNS